MRIGILSDTHIPQRAGRLPPSLFEAFAGVDLILHAGDLVEERVLDELSAIAPVEAVAGNMDPYLLVTRLGRHKLLQLPGGKLGLTHGDGASHSSTHRFALSTFAGQEVNCVIFGHTHQPFLLEEDGVLLFNPGSATNPRGESQPSCGIITLEDGPKAEIIFLPKNASRA